MATSANWRCADCDTYNEPAEASCTICGGTRRNGTPHAEPAASKPAAARSGAARSPAKRPGAARPSADWRCSKCDTNNARTDLFCIVCGTSWKAAAKKKTVPTPSAGKSAAKKSASRTTSPERPTPKRTPYSGSPSRDRTTPRASPSGPPRTSTPSSGARTSYGTPRSSTPPGEGGTGLFTPSSSTSGYRPTTPGPGTPFVPTPAPPATPHPAPRRSTTTPSKDSNRLGGCVGIILLCGLLGLLTRGCGSPFDSSDPDGSTPGSTAPACPGRIAAELPGGDGAELVEGFRTENKQITLCRTTAGSLFYYGEFSDRREKGIVLDAEVTSDGYEASNTPYRYVIHSGLVTIYRSGTQIGEERLAPDPSPS